MLFDFRASKFDQIAFSDVNLAIRNSLPMQKNHIYCLCRDFSYRRDQLLFLWFGAAKDALGVLHCA